MLENMVIMSLAFAVIALILIVAFCITIWPDRRSNVDRAGNREMKWNRDFHDPRFRSGSRS